MYVKCRAGAASVLINSVGLLRKWLTNRGASFVRGKSFYVTS